MEEPTHVKTINTLYAILVVSTIIGFMPNFNAQGFSIILWFVVWAAAYWYRRKDKEDSLLYNHTTYLIGTIGIGTTAICIGMLIAAFWIFMKGDRTAIDAMIGNIMNTGSFNMGEVQAAMDQAEADNKTLLWTASFVAIGPTILYFVYRVANGISRACKGYRIANPKSWL